MLIGSNINTLMQQVMAMKSPELIAILPSVEAQPYEDRVALVLRGKNNIDVVVKNWDKFSDVLEARGMTRSEVKKKSKDLKQVRSKLEMALRLADPKIIPAPFRNQAESAFNVLASWFEMNKDYMESVYAAPKLTRQDLGNIVLPPVSREKAGDEEGVDLVDTEALVEGPENARLVPENDIVDIMDISGKSSVH